MDQTYYNHYSHIAASWWDRRSFLANWWRIYANDSYWAPPYYPALQRALEPSQNDHLARMEQWLTYLEALPRRRHGSSIDPTVSMMPLMDIPVAATAILSDPRRRDGAAYLALFRCVNDANTLQKQVDSLIELLLTKGYRRLIGPTGLSPYLGSGVLHDHWGEVPPVYTPYNPPYLPEVIEQVLHPFSRAQLYHVDVPPDFSADVSSPADLLPFDPTRLRTNLLPLFSEACLSWARADFAPLDGVEAGFLLNWLQMWPLYGWLAEMGGEPVGFVLAQPDMAPALRRARGGRQPLWRLWLLWATRRPATRGCIPFMAVAPAWRRQGIGRQLLYQALAFAHAQGWRSLSFGPIPSGATANKFLQDHGGQPRQTYLLYQLNL